MRRTAPACSARAARAPPSCSGVEDRVDLRMGTFSKSLAACGGFVAGDAEVIDYLRISSRAFLFTASAVPAALGAALAALRIVRSDEGPELLAARARERPLLHRRPGRARLQGARAASPCGRARRRTPRAETIVTPIIPILIGDDWKAALLWRALYDAGVFTNCALHPAVPPGERCCRTSVMATHDHPTLDRALEAFALVKRDFEAEHGPLRGADGASRLHAGVLSTPLRRRRRSARPSDLSIYSQVSEATKKVASSARTDVREVDRTPPLRSLRKRSA